MPTRARHSPALWIVAVTLLALIAAAAAVGLIAASRGDASEAEAATPKPTYAQVAPAIAMYRARAYRSDDAIRLLHRARKTAGQKKVEPGESSGRVKEIQRQLVALHMLRRDQADGEYGDATQHAMMAFQKLNGLDRDGVAGPKTLVTLMKGGKKPEPFAKKGAPDRVEVSLEKQLVQVIKGGKVDRVVSASSGMPGHDTPPGTFAVYLKNPNAYSYLYDAPMPMASFFDGDIALHESGDVPGYPASHGCIRLPAAFATEVYDFASMGRQVIVV